MSINFKTPKGVDPNVKMTKEEIVSFYNKLEMNDDPYFGLLPFPDFMVKQNPEKYGGLREEEFKNIDNGIEYLKLLEEGKKEEAENLRRLFLKSLSKPIPPAIGNRFQFTPKPNLLIKKPNSATENL